VIPEVSAMPGCVCVSWWNTIDQVKALAGNVPSSVSVAVPAKFSVEPPVYVEPEAGIVIVATGGLLVVTVRTASLLVAEPSALVTTTLKWTPLSAA
jgi:hypothetical protein